MTSTNRIGTPFQRYLYANYRGFYTFKTAFQNRFTRAGFLVIAGLIATGTIGLDTNLVVTYQAFAFLVCLLVTAMISSRLALPQVTVRRELPRYATVGAPLRYTVHVTNLRPRLQPGLTFIEQPADPRPSLHEFCTTKEPGEEKRNWLDRRYVYYRWTWLIGLNQHAIPREQPLPVLPPNGEVEFATELVPLRRGTLRLLGLTINCPDAFGLYRSFVRVPAPERVLVLPRRYALPAVALPGSLKYQQGGVALASSVGESEEFISLRDYRPGDPRRHIHWKSWAKTGKPIVKEFQDEFFVRHALVLDTFSDDPYSDLFEEAVSVAASFACNLQTQDSLLDLMFVGSEAYCFTSGRGLAHAEQMLEVLAAVRVTNDTNFAALPRAVLDRISGVSGCVLVLLAWDERRQAFVKRLHQLAIPLRVFVIVPDNQPPLDPGPLRDQPQNLVSLPLTRVAQTLAAL